MILPRIIARIDIKNNYVIKGIHLEGLRKVGDPNEFALKYYNQGVDEIVFMDAVASLYDRNQLFDVIESASNDVFVPIAVGGGIRSCDDVSKALEVGADKVIINTGAFRKIDLIYEIATKYGSQCLVGSIEAKKNGSGWYCYTDNGREPTDIEVGDWVTKLQDAGVGEILLTSVDQEGTRKGFDINLVQYVDSISNRPIIVSGGYGIPLHAQDLLNTVQPSALAFASVLHYEIETIGNIKSHISSNRKSY
jgi:imidazole glycerol-phosphate synthase subunit HisF